jgi:hypothetical protein
MDIVYQNQNYLFYIAYLFRLEEALLEIIVENSYQDTLKINLKKKGDHGRLLDFLKSNEQELWDWLHRVMYKGEYLKFEGECLNRPIMFYLAYKKEEENSNGIFKSLLHLFDIINKYLYYELDDPKRLHKYGHSTAINCLGDLRNQSIIAHGFEPVSKDKIESLYKNNKQTFSDLHNALVSIVRKAIAGLSNDKSLTLENIYNQLNEKIKDRLIST